jgi:tetratricopeptide (TPR) repeat protein
LSAERRHRSDARRIFTTREVARLAQISPARVRRCIRDGYLKPRRGLRRRFEYDFADLLLLRATRALLEARVGPQRVAELLAELRRKLPHGRAPTTLDLKADGDGVLVREGRHRWHADSGQMLLDFDGPRRTREVHSLVDDDGSASYRSFSRALALEEVSPQEAIHAYHEALRRDPEAIPVHVNLGRLEHELGRLDTAERHYLEALRLDPDERTAAFNLAVLAEDRGHLRLAIRRYQQLLALAPDAADVHQRLARLYSRIGRHADARGHRRSYRRLLRRPAGTQTKESTT